MDAHLFGLLVRARLLTEQRGRLERDLEDLVAEATAAGVCKVDLADAHLSLTDGHVSLRGLAVTNPNAPLTNLFEIDELVFDAGILPALERKLVVDTLAARGIRFNTPRATSGAVPLEEESEEVRASSAVIEPSSRLKSIPCRTRVGP